MVTINKTRFWENFRHLSTIGATGDSGVSRPSLSPEDLQARAWFHDLVQHDGFAYNIDGAGNQSAIFHCSDENARTLLIGSHLDSVKNGGRFDGALGVMCAYETLCVLRDSDAQLPFHLEVINFTDEEGSLVGLLGSSALAGALTRSELQNPRGGREALIEGMARIGISDETILNAKRDPKSLCGYLEVHIEQGTRLEKSGINIGIVPALVGSRSFWLRFTGEAAHAGTMPMDQRRDAFWGAAKFTLHAKSHIMENFSPGVCNVGQATLLPGAFNIVPGQADISLEFRHGSTQDLDTMETALLNIAEDVAKNNHLALYVTPVDKKVPSQMDSMMITALENACNKLELSSKQMLSFALHDAQYLSQIIPTGMFFVPSVNGISHNPAELTHQQDCINGAEVMLNTIIELAAS